MSRIMRLLALACIALAFFTGCDANGTQRGPVQSADTAVVTADSTAVAAQSPAASDSVKPINRNVTIAVTGDIMTGILYPRAPLPASVTDNVFVDCADILRGANVACGNLEGVLADSGTPRKSQGPGNFSFLIPTKEVHKLVDAGYDFMSVANNHTNDFWEVGMKSTISTLQQAGLGVAGTSTTEYSIKEIDGVKYGFCAFGFNNYVLRINDTSTVRRIISELRPKVDILIVSFHGGAEGVEYKHVPVGHEYHGSQDRGDVRQFAHLSIDCGADLVFGHSPHVCRAVELYKGHLIAYSLGNFATPTGMRLEGERGYAPVITVTLNGAGEMMGGKIHSFIQQRMKGPRRDTRNLVAREIRQLTEQDIQDNKLNIADDGTISIKK